MRSLRMLALAALLAGVTPGAGASSDTCPFPDTQTPELLYFRQGPSPLFFYLHPLEDERRAEDQVSAVLNRVGNPRFLQAGTVFHVHVLDRLPDGTPGTGVWRVILDIDSGVFVTDMQPEDRFMGGQSEIVDAVLPPEELSAGRHHVRISAVDGCGNVGVLDQDVVHVPPAATATCDFPVDALC